MPGISDTHITVDCSKLVKDLRDRLSAGSPDADLHHDIYYGVEAEVDEFLRKLLSLVKSHMGNNMDKNIPNVVAVNVGCSTNPEPSHLIPFS